MVSRTNSISFPRSARECSSDAPRPVRQTAGRANATRRRALTIAFPRGAWERGWGLLFDGNQPNLFQIDQRPFDRTGGPHFDRLRAGGERDLADLRAAVIAPAGCGGNL